MPTILVADDNSNIQKMVALAFKGEGIDVVAVGNGEAAVRKAAEIIPDLVLADIFMPVRNGYEVCEYIKQDSKLSHIPVVLLVGAFDPFNEREAQRVSADGVLKKPFVPPDPLIGIVKNLLAKCATAQLVPVAVSGSESAVAAVSQPMQYTPPPPPSRRETPTEAENEIEEEAPVKDFSLPAAQVDSSRAGGADAFSSMLDTVPLGTVRPFLGAPVESHHPVEQEAHSSGIFASGAGLAAPVDHAAPANTEERTSPDDSAQFPPLREQIVRDWGVRSPSPSRSEDELDGEITPSPAREDWRASFPVSDSREAEILHPSEPALSPWRDFKLSTERVAERYTEDEPELTGGAETEQDAVQIAEPISEPVSEAPVELSSPIETDSASEPASVVEEAPSVGASSPVIDSEASSVVAGELKEHFPDLQEAAAVAWQDFNQQAGENASREDLIESPATSTDEVAADFAAHDPITHLAVDPGPAPPAPSSFEAANIVDFPSISEAVESVAPEAHAAQPENQQAEPAHAEPVSSELERSVENSAVTELHAIPAAESADPRVVEEIVARVVERMQPQILEIVTREVLRPVVEALVRKQLEQK